MSELIIVRHGQASFGSHNYDKLSALGLQQSQWLGEYFSQRNIIFSQLFIGQLKRHQETAEGILSALAEKPKSVILPGLNEFDFNDVCRAFIAKNPSAVLNAEASRNDYYRLLKKSMLAWSENLLPIDTLLESWADFKQRVEHALTEIMQHHGKEPVLVVSSGGVIAMIMSLVLGLPDKQVVDLNLQIRNSSLTQFHFNLKHIKLSSFNTIGHLDSPERQAAITYS